MNYAKTLEMLKIYGQEHLLKYYDELSQSEKQTLLSNIEKIDFSVLNEDRRYDGGGIGALTAADTMDLKHIRDNAEEYGQIGLRAIKSGKVAAVLLAGGQGTRLGISAPKGTFNIGVTRRLSIFGCQMESVKQVAAKAGYDFHLFIMTSEINDADTREFFKQNGYFGYNKDKIHFFVQDSTPACSLDNKVLMINKFTPSLVPNGNGGWYVSLVNSGLGGILKSEKIEWLNVYGVDNVLQKICDPVFIGATIKSGVKCSGKFVSKAYPEEKVGVLCKEDGVPTVIEYSEISDKERYARDEDGQLTFRAGVILNYLFSVDRLDKVCGNNLPYHIARKKVEYFDGGKTITPAEPNANKFELLAVDLIKLMGDCLAYEVEREKEFAPVKNATGVDSVDSARELLEKNGVKL